MLILFYLEFCVDFRNSIYFITEIRLSLFNAERSSTMLFNVFPAYVFGKEIQDLESSWINQECNLQKHRKVLPEQAKSVLGVLFSRFHIWNNFAVIFPNSWQRNFVCNCLLLLNSLIDQKWSP